MKGNNIHFVQMCVIVFNVCHCAITYGLEDRAQEGNKGLKELSRGTQKHQVSVNRGLLGEGHRCIVC